MVTVKLTRPADVLREEGVMRQTELLDEAGPPVRSRLDELAIEGKIKRFPVGNYIMVRWEGD